MKYIRTYETEEKFLADKDSTSRGFRLKPVLYKYSETGDHIHLKLDDPRKHGDSTYIKIYIDSDIEFSFYIGNKSGDTQTTMTCTIDWGDGTVETKTITEEIIGDEYDDNKGFKLSHNYKAGSYEIELYDVERDYVTAKGTTYWGEYTSLISHPSSIRRVVLGGSIVSMGMSTFAGCSSLTSVYISEGFTSIGEGAFYGCVGLTSIYIPNSVTSIEGDAFNRCSSLTSIYIPNSVTSIGYAAFANNPSLTSVYIPESVTTIGDGAFKNCTSLKSIHIPEGVTTIGSTTYEGVFEECTSLTSVYIPRSVTIIGRNAFKGCSSLTSIDIPEGVTTIDDGTFNNCTSLSSVSLHSDMPPILNGFAFDYLPANGILHIKRGVGTNWEWEAFLGYFDNWRIVEDL